MKWTSQEFEQLHQLVRENPQLKVDDVAGLFPNHGLEGIGRKIRRIRRPEALPFGAAPGSEVLPDMILTLLKKRGNYTLSELCDALDYAPGKIETAIATLKEGGYRIDLSNGSFHIPPPKLGGTTRLPLEHFIDGRVVRFGVVSDTHISNVHHRADILESAYDMFEHEGIRSVLHGGNWIDGIMASGKNRMELITKPTFHDQVDFFISSYPQRPGITTYYISGDDHEGWHQQEGYDVGFYLESWARKRGRTDLRNLGYGEANLPFAMNGGKDAILRLIHPKGGSAAGYSTKTQRIIDSYERTDLPQLLFVGHFHKYGSFYHRGVHALMLGCMEGQSYFMRGNQLQSHLGYCIVDFMVQKDGTVPSIRVEWKTFPPLVEEGYEFEDARAVSPIRINDDLLDDDLEERIMREVAV